MKLRCAACDSRYPVRRPACPSCGHRRPGATPSAPVSQASPRRRWLPVAVGAFLTSMTLLAVVTGGPWFPGSGAETEAASVDLPTGVAEAWSESTIVDRAFDRTTWNGTQPLDEAEREEARHYNPARLRSFFDSFDRDADGELDPAEAVAFYDWVEHNVTYRHDDEHADPEIPGTPVGDGREGHDYQQSPVETFDERMGDCEDTSTLLVSFHRYWGQPAYQALVDTEPGEGVSHATAIVDVGEAPEDYPEPEEGFHTYTFEPDNEFGVEAGTYVVADNTYSDTFGTITGDLAPGTFEVHDIETLTDSLQRSDDWRG